MAIQTVPRHSIFRPCNFLNASQVTVVLDSTNDWQAALFYWPGGDLVAIRAYFSAVFGSPSVRAQLFNADLTSATPVDTGSPIGNTVDVSVAVGGNTFNGLGATSLAAGIYAIRFIFMSGTSATLVRASKVLFDSQFPCWAGVVDGGSQGVATGGGIPIAFSSDASTWFCPEGFTPPIQLSIAVYADSSGADEHGVWFQYPLSVRICGVGLYNNQNARPDVTVNLYEGTTGSPTLATGFPFTVSRAGVINGSRFYNYYNFPTKYTLPANTNIGIGIRSASNHSQGFHYFDFGSGNEALMDMWNGQNCVLFTRNNGAGALTTITYQQPLMDVVIDGIDDGGGGGGTVVGNVFKSLVFGG